MKTKFIRYIIGIGVILLMTGCIGNFEKYNTHPYQPSKVEANTLLKTMFQVYASPQQNDCQFNNTMWACFSGHVTAPQNWSKGGSLFCYYNAVEDFNRYSWNMYQEKIYTNFFQIQAMTQEQGVVYSIALLTRVYAMHILASLQGPIPYTGIKAGETVVPYDDEKTVWHSLFEDLDKVIAILNDAKGINPELKNVDQFYAGDCAKWLRFANTLKLRMAMRISGVEPDYARIKAEEAVASGVMEDVSDSSWDTTHSGFGVNGYAMVSGWGEVRANACLVSCMNGYEDPRRPKYFTEQVQTKDGGYVGVRSGSADLPETGVYANYSKLLIGTDNQLIQPVMYAAEAAFLRAEGALKGWNMGGTPQSFYEKGIRLSFEEYEVKGVDAYINDNTRRPAKYEDNLTPNHIGNNCDAMSTVTIKWDESADDKVKLEKILIQKWIACFLDPLNGWSDFRRTGLPKIFPATKSENPDCTVARGQRRLRFADSEYNNNKENVMAAVSMLSNGKDSNGTDLWWALKENGQY